VLVLVFFKAPVPNASPVLVEASVMSLASVCPLTSSMLPVPPFPPLSVTVPVPKAVAEPAMIMLALLASPGALTTIPPENELSPESVRVPVPVLVRLPPVPERSPEKSDAVVVPPSESVLPPMSRARLPERPLIV